MSILMSFLFVAGLALAGSDGPHFPIPNLLGLGCWVLMLAVSSRGRRGQAGAPR